MNYLICSTGRARSGVLASYLKQVGCGAPDEFYERKRFDLNRSQSVDAVRKYITGQRVGGIFGMRMVWSHVRTMYVALDMKLSDFVSVFLPGCHYIFHTRDPFMQAIESSLYNMRRSGMAWDMENVCLETIKRRVVQIIVGNHAWREFFLLRAVDPILTDGRSLEYSPQSVIKHVVNALDVGIEVPVLSNRFRDDLMCDFRDEVYERLFSRYAGMMSDVNIKEYL